MPKFIQRFFDIFSKNEPEAPSEGARMSEFQRRIQRAVANILENETLTADLDDEAAQELLNWGVEQAEAITATTFDLDETRAEEVVYQPMRALRKLLRVTNKWALDPQERNLGRILQQAELVYGHSPDEAQQAAFVAALPEDAVGRVRALHSFLAGEEQDSAEV